MSSITIRNLDPVVKERLRVRAAEHGHSMEAEVRRILQAADSRFLRRRHLQLHSWCSYSQAIQTLLHASSPRYEKIIQFSSGARAVAVVEKHTVSLPPDQARYMDDLVASGVHASASEVVRAGLRAPQERDAAVERWLREEVAPAYNAMRGDPGQALDADQVGAALQAHHTARLKADQRGT